MATRFAFSRFANPARDGRPNASRTDVASKNRLRAMVLTSETVAGCGKCQVVVESRAHDVAHRSWLPDARRRSHDRHAAGVEVSVTGQIRQQEPTHELEPGNSGCRAALGQSSDDFDSVQVVFVGWIAAKHLTTVFNWKRVRIVFEDLPVESTGDEADNTVLVPDTRMVQFR